MSGLPQEELGRVYQLADSDSDGRLSQNEFFVAMKLIRTRLAGHQLPSVLPPELSIGSSSVSHTGAAAASGGSVVKCVVPRGSSLTFVDFLKTGLQT